MEKNSNNRRFNFVAVMLSLILLVGGFGIYKLFVYLTIKDIAITERNTKLPPLSNIKLIPYRKGKLWGFSDPNRNILIEPKYESAEPFKDDLALIRLNGKSGFIDPTGREIIFNKYTGVYNFSEGLAAFYDERGGGYINKNFQEIISPKYREPHAFFKGDVTTVRLALANSLEGNMVLLDKSDQVVSKKYEYLGEFSEGLIWMSTSYGKCGYIDKTGKEIIPEKYTKCRSFSEGLAVVELDGKFGIIDKTGQTVLPFKYYDAGIFSEGLIAVVSNGRVGFIDKSGKEIIPFKFDGVSETTDYSGDYKKYNYIYNIEQSMFKEGLAPVKINGSWGYIDKTGKVVIASKYKWAYPFENGIARVETQKSEFNYVRLDGTEYFED